MDLIKNLLKKVKVSFPLIGKFFYWFITFILILVAGTIAVSAFNLPNGLRLYNVQTGSMAPTIKAGSVIIVQLKDIYKKGDIITFTTDKYRGALNPKETTTHRIFSVKKTKTDTYYSTKGDFNPSPDIRLIKSDLVLGKVIGSVPYLGFPISLAKTPVGFFVLIIIPAGLIIFGEFINIKKEIIKILKKRKK